MNNIQRKKLGKLQKKLKSNQKKKHELPRQIIPLPNADKTWHEKWGNGDDPLNFPHPFRAVIFGPPNSTGKTTICKNILLRQDPPFRKLYVVHIDGHYTKEYKDVDAEMLDTIPPPDSPLFDGKYKTLIVLEDLEYKFKDKKQLRNLDRLLGYVSTHKNVSVCILSQDAFNLPPACRRMANVWILGKARDFDSFKCIARKCSLDNETFQNLFHKYVKKEHDTIWVDYTKNTPFPLRLNGYQMIDANHINQKKYDEYI